MNTIRQIIKTVFPDSVQMYRKVRRIAGYGDTHWVREVMDVETGKLVRKVSLPEMSVLEISGNKWGQTNSFRKYTSVEYPDYDVCAGPLPERFDLIIAEQVFEHLQWPYRAGRNIYQMLNPGGYFLISTPFLLKVHNYPIDCSRWTETGLKYFLAECGFPLESMTTSSWGNRACIKANLNGWTPYNKWFHSLRNEPDFPAVVWGLCRKTESAAKATWDADPEEQPPYPVPMPTD
jgi:SAM-dependent methyltransferase